MKPVTGLKKLGTYKSDEKGKGSYDGKREVES